MQHVKNSRVGYHRPPPPPLPCTTVGVSICVYVRVLIAIKLCLALKKKKKKRKKKERNLKALGREEGVGGGGGERKHSSCIFRRNSMMPLLILGKKRTALQLIQIMHVCLALILFASNLELLDQLKHKQESYNLKHLSAGEFSTSAWCDTSAWCAWCAWWTLSSKFSEDSERSPSAIGDFHWQSKHGGSFGG